MPNYRETEASAVSWRRAASAVIYNPLPGQGVPRIVFDEQDVVSSAGKVIAASQVFGAPDAVSARFDADTSIVLLDPETGEPTGETMTHQQLRVALHSLYMDAARKRDEALAAVETQNPQPAQAQQ